LLQADHPLVFSRRENPVCCKQQKKRQLPIGTPGRPESAKGAANQTFRFVGSAP
jgi:hypothetical protein